MPPRVLDQQQARALARRGDEFRSSAVVEATQLNAAEEWTSGGGSELRGRAGDWLLRDGDDRWTITDEAFRATYEQLPDRTWSKRGTVRAVRLDEAVDIETLEGRSHAECGDWLATSEAAGTWPVSAAVFQRRYAPVEAT